MVMSQHNEQLYNCHCVFAVLTIHLSCFCLFLYLQDFEIDQDTDTEQVDELLALCVKQALQQNQTEELTSS